MIFSNPWKQAEPAPFFFSKPWKIFLLLFVCSTLAVAQEPGRELSGFRVPDYDEKGVMTSQLFGDRAEMEGGGMVKITGVSMEFYKDDEVYMTVTSPHCFFNQKTREAHSEAPVAADMKGIHVRGRGFKLNSADRKVQVFNESKVIIEDVMEQNNDISSVESLDTNEVTVITSKELYLDYNGRTVRFEESVHVQDPEMTMDCDTLTARFNENNDIDWITASGDDCRLEGGMDPVVSDEGEAATKAPEETPEKVSDKIIITSKDFFLDYSERTVRFEKSVHVTEPRMEMDCETMTVRFSEKNKINWLEALTHVRILSEGREGHAEKATYDAATDEFLLEDNPRLLEGRNVLTGDRIRFWRATGRMVCEPSARLIMYSDDESEFELFEK